MSTIAVTGATGNIGRRLTLRLREAGVSVRAIGRSADRLAALTDAGAEARVGDLGDAGFLADSLRGADSALVMLPPKPAALDLKREQRSVAKAVVDALTEAHVPRVVLVSSVGAEIPSGTGPIEVLHDLEAWLRKRKGTSLTILRPTYFMENHLAAIPGIRAQGAMYGGLRPELTIPMIATKDIAAAAFEALTANAPEGVALRHLLGPRDYAFSEVAAVLGRAIGREDLRYVQVAPEPLRAALLAAGLSASTANAYLEMNRSMDDGRLLAAVRRTPEATTPTTLEEFARETFAPAYAAA